MEQDIMKINTKIDIARLGDNNYYHSSIQDLDEKYLYIALPTFMSQPLILLPGETVTVRFTGPSECFIGTCKVIGFKKDSISMFRLTKPNNLERVQQRKFFRYATLMDVFYADIPGEGNNPEYIHAKALDISGGGMKLLLNKPYSVGSQLLLKFQITGKNGDFQEIQSKVRVIRKEASRPEQDKYHIMGVEFIELTETQRCKIIGYIYREMAKKGLGR
ncbi:flagellar brake protein [Desulfolucanica intricata]|uniref:flagellar brake protein n=1 Tax=Desulfolucanica intricata TaxID=1285191 RepID=UPI00083179B7|nr:flagellar brake domain-containing protein [Desulfolucanica intricata]